MLIGKRIYLRLVEKRDLVSRVEWINDEENIKTLLFDYPTSIAKTEKWFFNVLMDNSKVNFSIDDMESHQLIGMTGLLNIDRVNSHAQFYVTIGNKSFRGQRLSDEVIPLVMEYGFVELGLLKIYLYTLPNNEKARRIYERNGFVKDGILRQQVFCRGQQQDIYVHSILKEEWQNRTKKY